MPWRATPSGDRAIPEPANVIAPERRTVPEIARRVVVLPAPFAPSTATTSPSPTSSETPCRALTAP